MSAEVLREAAALMRKRAEACEALSFLSPLDMAGYSCDGGWITAQDEVIAEHYAPLSPAVALAVADWLDVVAARNEVLLSSFPEGSRAGAVTAAENSLGWTEALAVARAYLGSDS